MTNDRSSSTKHTAKLPNNIAVPITPNNNANAVTRSMLSVDHIKEYQQYLKTKHQQSSQAKKIRQSQPRDKTASNILFGLQVKKLNDLDDEGLLNPILSTRRNQRPHESSTPVGSIS